MKSFLAAAVAAVLVAAAPASAQDTAGRGLVTAKLDTVTAALASSGFTPAGEPTIVSIPADNSTEVQMQVQAGKGYVIVGICDENCGDLDLLVLKADGTTVGQDVADDNAPLVTYVATENTTLRVRVSMAGCTAASCLAGAALYSGDPAALQ
jgi:hypothetical protein